MVTRHLVEVATERTAAPVMGIAGRALCTVLAVAVAAAARDLWAHPEHWEHLPFERGPRKLNAAIDAATAVALLLAAAGVPWPGALRRALRRRWAGDVGAARRR